MLRIVRRGDRHDARDLTVTVTLEGDFAAAFLEGRPDVVFPGETLKRLVYAVARDYGGRDIERFGLLLCERVLSAHARITRARIEMTELPWARLQAGGKAQGQVFTSGGVELRTAVVTSTGEETFVTAGIERLVLMRSSGFLARSAGTRADDGSEDAVQGLLAGTLNARWTYVNPEVTFGAYREGVRGAILDTFALHAARSVQYTLYAIADVVLATHEDIRDVTLAMEERPFLPVDPFGPGDGEPEGVFLAGEAPLRTVEVTVERDKDPL